MLCVKSWRLRDELGWPVSRCRTGGPCLLHNALWNRDPGLSCMGVLQELELTLVFHDRLHGQRSLGRRVAEG